MPCTSYPQIKLQPIISCASIYLSDNWLLDADLHAVQLQLDHKFQEQQRMLATETTLSVTERKTVLLYRMLYKGIRMYLHKKNMNT